MTRAGKFTITAIVAIGLLAVGIIYSLRACLAQYDERSSPSGKVLHFSTGDKEMLFALVKFDKTIAYSRRGNFIQKNVNTSYFIQANDAASLKKVSSRKIKKQRDIKYHPVEILGASGGLAWVFIGELMAFHPATLETMADKKIIAEKNPQLGQLLPDERRYYELGEDKDALFIIAKDGSRWKLDTKTLLAAQTGDDTRAEGETGHIETLLKEIRTKEDSLNQQKNYRPSRLLAEKKISREQYARLTKEWMSERKVLYVVRDSLMLLQRQAAQVRRNQDETRRRQEALQRSSGISFSQMKVNADTLPGNWYGLFSQKEISKQSDRFSYSTVYDETARRQLYRSTYQTDKNGTARINASSITQLPSPLLLDAGFLLHGQTGLPAKMENGDYLVVHKDQVGQEGHILLSRLSLSGSVLWTASSALSSWAGWVITPSHIYITGKDNKELSGGEVNVLLGIELAGGTLSRYDYFTDK